MSGDGALALQPLYLDVDGTPAFAVLHDAPARAGGNTAVIFCPPFGWEEVCSYRLIREWASRLARANVPALRLTLPGCGDSGGDPRDPDCVTAWTRAVAVASEALRAATAARRVVAVGLGLGGILAYRAAACGAGIDGLVLWAAPARAKQLVRQLRAISRMEAAQMFEGLEAPPALPHGELEAGGFVLSAQTQADLEAVDLSIMSLPNGLASGALLLGRDGVGPDQSLCDALQGQGISVAVGSGDGYAAMTAHPQRAELPAQVMLEVSAWLEAGGGAASGSGSDSCLRPAGSKSAHLQVGGTALSETPVAIAQDFGCLSGILTTAHRQPAPVCVVMLNAGAMRRIGPNRMWVEAARRWAARGVPTLRLDVEGIGEADGALAPYVSDGALYVPRLVPQVLAAVDHLSRRSVAERFILLGLCGGAYWSLHGALEDQRVCAAWMLNPRAIVWDTGLAPSRDLRRVFSQPLTWTRLRNNVTPARATAVLRWLVGLPAERMLRTDRGAARLSRGDRIDATIGRLRDSGKRALLLFSAAEPLEEELVDSGRMAELARCPNICIERIAVRDHTLRPAWAQDQAHAALDRALDRELALIEAPTV